MQTRRTILRIFVAWPLCPRAHANPPSRPMEYRLAPTADYAFTSYRLSQEVRPRDLARVFGQPILERGDPESLGTYVFVGPDNEVLTVYYRANDVDEKQLEHIRVQFWQSSEAYSFSIGARSYAHAPRFREWLIRQLQAR